ncbi:prepilin-type processing-associated H-X9-DG domain-containing protein [Singulisphaera sp. GP187]|uniref:DUF1559 family PulG-like putative transporter n=1 Tax=Singulisphaera sp. GP187 TaxID=1882752 RepID=UPI0009284B1A|nr:DUF1559 domain-containing protein [Singulisphaera sp. GP187]SIO43262.1 prepilin-type processing-associated H-X9-DG domain-containing protein [Singulisphaera sp. GP187]
MLKLRSPKAGLTLIEILVVIATLGLLLGLLLPAIQASREAARRAGCASNLRQIGVAIHSYLTDMQSFPPGSNAGRAFSMHAMLLPKLGETRLYEQIEFRSGKPFLSYSYDENFSVSSVSLSVFLCPSDARPSMQANGFTNYAGNGGSGTQAYGYNGIFVPGNAPPVVPGSVIDGFSSTALMAEWMLGGGASGVQDPRRTVFATPVSLIRPDQLELFAEQCRLQVLEAGQSITSNKGANWLYGEFGHTIYNHVLNPNESSCTNGTLVHEGAWTASSLHGEGSHVLFVDGHIQFLRNSIHKNIWRAIGSRAGGDNCGTDAF